MSGIRGWGSRIVTVEAAHVSRATSVGPLELWNKLTPNINSGANVKTMQLLIVDDSPSHCKTLSGLLTLYDIQSHAAYNGIEALERVGEQNYDAMLLDWVMPGLDGYDTLMRLREMPSHRHLPVIIVTGCAIEDVQYLGTLAGANAFMNKPVDIDRLLALLDDVVAENRCVA
jgi:CheY-like chemotaxis protein